MEENTWYELSDIYNGEPFAYLSNKEHIEDFKDKKFEIEIVKNPSFLEFIVSNQDLQKIASFKDKSLAYVFDIKYLNGKGIIEPNPIH